MINTVFLTKQTDTYNKAFSQLNVPSMALTKMSPVDKFKVAREVSFSTRTTESFRISAGRVELYKSNQIFNLEHIPGNVDIILPKAKKLLDWIVLWYDQDKTIYSVSNERHSLIKLYGNGSRIMGYDEPMLCDMPFMSLRLTFISDVDGWIVT